MSGWVRGVVVAVLSVHAAIHLLGAAKGLGWADVPQLKGAIGTSAGLAWLVAGTAVGVAGALLAAGAAWWWMAAALAAVVSQAVIFTSWPDAKVGSAVNVLLLVGAVLGCAAHGPGSFDTRWQNRSDAALAESTRTSDVVGEADLADLPDALAGYLRRAGVVGQPRPGSAYVTFHGRIRSGADQPWMTFTSRQVSTFGTHPTRTFLMHATKAGLPVTVLHVYEQGRATMQGKVLSILPVLDASGPEMDRGETVTVFNDMVLLAPAALLDAAVVWTSVSPHEVDGSFTIGSQVVTATLRFSRDDELVDFVSEDRLRASEDGKSFTRQTWSTPIESHQQIGQRRLPFEAQALWHAPAPEGAFAYIEMTVDSVSYDPRTTAHRPATALPSLVRHP